MDCFEAIDDWLANVRDCLKFNKSIFSDGGGVVMEADLSFKWAVLKLSKAESSNQISRTVERIIDNILHIPIRAYF